MYIDISNTIIQDNGNGTGKVVLDIEKEKISGATLVYSSGNKAIEIQMYLNPLVVYEPPIFQGNYHRSKVTENPYKITAGISAVCFCTMLAYTE